jgi:hypothetical protein
VEAEVYAMASLFISLLFLVRLTLLEQDMDSLTDGCSISLVVIFWVHFMALLTIPSIGFTFKHYKTVTVKKLHHYQRCSYFNVCLFSSYTLTMSFFAGTEVLLLMN